MTPHGHRMLLRAAVAAGGVVPVGAGLTGVLIGPAMLQGMPPLDALPLESHYRYLSGLLLAIGLGFWSTLRDIDQQGERFRLLTAIVVAGGVGRLLGLVVVEPPDVGMMFGLGMELVVTPLLCLWQGAVARISQREEG
ncbi:DUF4345 domain-containing protein [Roseomonas sp. M0104]|uniref:DUF4345 domain-containing protein n=1 Tax=Teichococcus coralli TaxID=2545983 RepID=A0A845B726_9PROT|nr:DUF4345 domain-containing protein [Pseudoroseomonas coralli]MXP62050.1 DUF4345 domain-containing protein [Pseudoroseomonas coralli]